MEIQILFACFGIRFAKLPSEWKELIRVYKVFLDHLSILVSGQEDNGDERKSIDILMTKLRSLVEETGIGLLLVSHLRRPSGDRGHEDGREVSLSHLRGSASIAHLSDSVIALERNQQADDDIEANTTTIRVLKNRYTGDTGVACYLHYDGKTGRMTQVDNPFMENAFKSKSGTVLSNGFKDAEKIFVSAVKSHEKRLKKYGSLGY